MRGEIVVGAVQPDRSTVICSLLHSIYSSERHDPWTGHHVGTLYNNVTCLLPETNYVSDMCKQIQTYEMLMGLRGLKAIEKKERRKQEFWLFLCLFCFLR